MSGIRVVSTRRSKELKIVQTKVVSEFTFEKNKNKIRLSPSVANSCDVFATLVAFSLHSFFGSQMSLVTDRLVGQLYDLLGKKYAVKFGSECSKVTTWMVVVLVIKYSVYLLKIEHFFPIGMIFAFPYPMQILGKYLPWMKGGIFPLLPVRLAESIMGRISPMRLTVLIPAHFLGCILGTTIVSLFLPPSCILGPSAYIDNQSHWVYSTLVEVLMVSIYVTLLIAVPEVNICPCLLQLSYLSMSC